MDLESINQELYELRKELKELRMEVTYMKKDAYLANLEKQYPDAYICIRTFGHTFGGTPIVGTTDEYACRDCGKEFIYKDFESMGFGAMVPKI